jgi:hypothetical protein
MPLTLCVCAIARQETPYLLEWIAYQRLIGADSIIIYDNGHDAQGRAILGTLARHGVIEHIPWSGHFAHGPQVPAYDDALNRLRGQAEWVLFIDLDEFLVLPGHENLPAFLDGMSDSDGIWFPWLIFGSGGQDKPRPEPMIERFRHRQMIDDGMLTPVKSVVRPDRTVAAHIHVHRIDTQAYTNPLGEQAYELSSDGGRRSSQKARGHSVARIHHYMTKSQAEWQAKVARGRADRGFKDEAPGGIATSRKMKAPWPVCRLCARRWHC